MNKEALQFVLGNKSIMTFVKNQAMDKVADDIRNKTGSGMTAEAVELMLLQRFDETVLKRYSEYLAIGIHEVVKLREELHKNENKSF